jgi:hypothetical protein
MFAENIVGTLQTPTFALQSTYDAFQVPEIARLAPADVAAINAYGAELERRLNTSYLASSPRHAVFLDSCYHHVGEWGQIVIDGQDQAAALLEFYAAVRDSRAAREGGAAAREGGAPRQLWRQGRAYPCAACCHGGQRVSGAVSL